MVGLQTGMRVLRGRGSPAPRAPDDGHRRRGAPASGTPSTRRGPRARRSSCASPSISRRERARTPAPFEVAVAGFRPGTPELDASRPRPRPDHPSPRRDPPPSARRHPRRRHGGPRRRVAAERAGLAGASSSRSPCTSAAGGSAARARAAAACTAASRSTACTSGSATTRTRSGCCASATPSSTARRPTRRRRSGPGSEAMLPAGTVGLEDRHGGGWHHWVGGVHAERRAARRAGATGAMSRVRRAGAPRARGWSPTSWSRCRPRRPTAAGGACHRSAPAAGPRRDRRRAGDHRRSPRPGSGHAAARGCDRVRTWPAPVAALDARSTSSGDAAGRVGRRRRPAAHLAPRLGDDGASLRGMLADGLLTDPAASAASTTRTSCDWIARHGAAPSRSIRLRPRASTTSCSPTRTATAPSHGVSAGRRLFLTAKMFFEYRGAIFWKMAAGMGDVVFAPLYEALRRRGVEFEFFHRVDELHLSGDRPARRRDHGRPPGALADGRRPLRAARPGRRPPVLPGRAARRPARRRRRIADHAARVALVHVARRRDAASCAAARTSTSSCFAIPVGDGTARLPRS